MLTIPEFVCERVEYWWKRLYFEYIAGEGYSKIREQGMIIPPKVEFSNRMTSSLGHAYSFDGRLVRFNLKLMAVTPPERFDRGIAHEVAHVFVDIFHMKYCRHGKQWREAMESLGFEALRLEPNMNLGDKYKVTCGCESGCYIGPIRMKKLINRVSEYHCLRCLQILKVPERTP